MVSGSFSEVDSRRFSLATADRACIRIKTRIMTIPAQISLPQPVLVTGASGFIGGHLCRRLMDTGHTVLAVTRSEDGPLPQGVKRLVANLTDHAEVVRLFDEEKPQTIFHLASHVVGRRGIEEVLPSFQNTLESSVNLLLAAQGRCAGRFILSGSLEEPKTVCEAPTSPYATCKQAAAAFARMFHALYGLPVVIARVFMVYGPDQKDQTKLIPYVIESLLNNQSPRLGSGTRPVDWIHVADVVEGLLALATTPGIEGQTLDIGTGRLETIRTVVEHLARLVPSEGKPVFDPAGDRPLEQIRKADIEATRAATGWSPRIVLEDGLADTARWHFHQRSSIVRAP
jgi:UDP-glucose 4-epimerase